MIIVTDIRLPLSSDPENAAPERAREMLGIKKNDIKSARLRRMSVDSRHGKYSFVCSVIIETVEPELEVQLVSSKEHVAAFEKVSVNPVIGNKKLAGRPVIAGFGPAGMFCACLLAEYGYRPVVLERGADIDTRASLVDAFWSGKGLDTSSNVQFGEGGAGTFSDGKLVTRINDPLCDYVLERFCEFGAPADIMYRAKPHIGTDMLRVIVKNMRRHITELGGEIRFNSPLDDIRFTCEGNAVAVTGDSDIETGALVIACGHSARDTFGMLNRRGFELEAKAFSVGFRIEHPQVLIDRGLYGPMAGSRGLPPGEYSLSQKVGSRTVYTFCMCPGGRVVAATSEEGGVVTNGMSMYARDGINANSAVAVSVSAEDFGKDPFRAIEFQRGIEQRAFACAGGDYRAPAQSVISFMNKGSASFDGSGVEPTYLPGVTCSELSGVLGTELSDSIRNGLASFGRKIKDFDKTGLLTGPETRTSSPVRIQRNEFRTAVGRDCVYPAGEGAGYAGGISSAAVDGLKTAIKIIERYKPN